MTKVTHPPRWISAVSAETSAASWPPKNGAPYNWDLPTQEAYYDDQEHDFSGVFGEARQKLDYSYHRHPAAKRKLLQDAILSQVFQIEKAHIDIPTVKRPWLVFSAGPMGVGKSYALSKLHSVGYFPLDQFIKVDPDMLKSEIPEFPGYLKENPDTAATLLHGESTQMADILFYHALDNHRDVLVDGSLRDVDWYSSLIQETIREKYPDYRIAIVHVTARDETIRQRAKDRAKTSGRTVPTDLLEDSIKQVPKSVEALTSLVDKVFTIANNDNEPIKLVEGDWGGFSATWEHSSEMHQEHELLCDMANVWHDVEHHAVLRDLWGKAYPTFCPRCTLSSDGICMCEHAKKMLTDLNSLA